MSTTDPEITVGLPVHNGAAYLAPALDAILASTDCRFELIVADNASTDDTPALCREYAARDARMRCLWSNVNRGAVWNYNRIVPEARGRFFKWAAHDDMIAPSLLSRCRDGLAADPGVALCYARTVLIDAEGRRTGPYADNLELTAPAPETRFSRFLDAFRQPRKCNPIFGLIRTSFLRRTPLFGPYLSSDVVLLAELALHGTYREVPAPLFFRRDHPGRSRRANVRTRDVATWFDTASRGRVYMEHWRLWYELAQAIRRAPLSAARRRRCARSLLVWAWRRRRRLGRDLAVRLGLLPES